MIGIIAWLVRSKFGRVVASIALIAASIGLIALSAKSAGIKHERKRQLAQSLKNLRKRIKTDEQIAQQPDHIVRARLRGWLRDD